jgi:diguanylate cyclase (GGDEF)-like protein
MSNVQVLLKPMSEIVGATVTDQAESVQILIADDSPVSRRLLEVVLRNWGYQVTAVSSGTEAWQILQRPKAPRLAILDWMMPGLSGPEVCSLVRQHQGQPDSVYTYIILRTSRNEKDDLIAGMEAGADDYLVKPFDNNELKVRLGPGRRIVQLQAQLLEAQEALREQATRDALTKLWNRHAILEILSRELDRTAREGKPLGLLLGDLDHFKAVNDTYGHVAGDTVLREVAGRFSASIRSYDAAGRYGGEEFLIVLPGCDGDAAFQTADRIRATVSQQPVCLGEDGTVEVTASFGATSLPRGHSGSAEELIRAADTALYRAKERGRNLTVFLPFSG